LLRFWVVFPEPLISLAENPILPGDRNRQNCLKYVLKQPVAGFPKSSPLFQGAEVFERSECTSPRFPRSSPISGEPCQFALPPRRQRSA